MNRSLLALAALLISACGRDEGASGSSAKPATEMTVAELEVAAAAGRPDAMGRLGQRYHAGDGVERALGRASDLFRRAAERGDVSSMHNLAVMLQHGEGVPKDEAGAFGWYLRAAEGGHAQAAKFTGLMYKLGVGTPKNRPEALRWFEKAAERGVEDIHGSIADLYFHGDGVPQDYARAREAWLKAARRGEGVAYARLGILYQQGLGVPANREEADKWIRLASATSTGASLVEAIVSDWEATDPEILYGFGIWLEQKGKHDQAVTAMRRGAAAGSASARTWLAVHDR